MITRQLRLKDLYLSKRAETFLKQINIKFAYEVTRFSQKELMNYKGVGISTVKEIKEALGEMGFELKND